MPDSIPPLINPPRKPLDRPAVMVPVLLAVVLSLGGTIIWGVTSLMKSCDAYKQAVSRAQGDQRVVRALGQPITPGYFVTGNVKLVNDGGKADLQFTVSGPKGEGTLYLNATKSAGNWYFDQLFVKTEAETIDVRRTDNGM